MVAGRSRAPWPPPSTAAFATTAGAVLVEEFLTGTEFSVVVLDGPSGPTALAPTEVEKPPASLVYGTEEKYLHGSGVIHHTPMRTDDESLHGIRRRAADAFRILGLRHMARIDGFRTDEGTVVVTDVNGIGGMGFSSFVFQQAAMVGIDHRHLILGLLGAASDGTPVTAASARRRAAGARRIHVVLGGPTSERQVSRQSGCFVGLSLLATGSDVRFFLMDLQSRYTEIGLFYVLHHDVEEIQALVGDPVRRAVIEAVGATVRADLGLGEEAARAALRMGHTVALADVAREADLVFLALHGGPGEDGRLQLALDRLGCPYNGSGPRAADVAADKAATATRVRELGLPGAGAPSQRQVDIFELGAWVDEMDGPGAAATRYAALCDELSARALVCKPATDGCSTGVKLLRRPEVMQRFFAAIVAEAPEFVTDEARSDLRGRTPSIAMPVPSPKHWLVERAFVDPTPVPLPTGDLNLESLRPWFEAKQFVELTVGGARPARTRAGGRRPERDGGGRGADAPAEVPERGRHQSGPRPVRRPRGRRVGAKAGRAAGPRLRHRGLRAARRLLGPGGGRRVPPRDQFALRPDRGHRLLLPVAGRCRPAAPLGGAPPHRRGRDRAGRAPAGHRPGPPGRMTVGGRSA